MPCMPRAGHRLAITIAVLVAALVPALAQDRTEGRLFYEMVVTNPGTRSQGWTGALFGPDGSALTAAPDAVIDTKIGAFRYHVCSVPWDACGFIREGSLPVPGSPSLAVLTDPLGHHFRLYVTAEGSRSEGWRGELWHGDAVLTPVAGETVDTVMGRFLALEPGDVPWGWHGWQPESWSGGPAQ